MSEALDAFLSGYLECMLWLSTDFSDESGGEPLDANYSTEDIAPSFLKECEQDCRDFLESNYKDLSDAYLTGYHYESLGHDFWLTRNHHGAGFWDRGLGAVGARLTSAAHAYGSVDPCVGDDGRIYG